MSYFGEENDEKFYRKGYICDCFIAQKESKLRRKKNQKMYAQKIGDSLVSSKGLSIKYISSELGRGLQNVGKCKEASRNIILLVFIFHHSMH